MKHYFLAKKNTVEDKVWLDKHFSDSTPEKSTAEKCFAKFKRGEISIKEDVRNGHAQKRLLPTKTSKKCTK
jgi:hypothetical protein